MADGTFNVAKGRINELTRRVDGNDPSNSVYVVVLLKVAEADATLEDYDNLSLLLASTGNTEADFTNYARKILSDTDISTPTVDDTGNTQTSDFPDQTWTSAGGTTDNDLVKLLVCYDSDSTGGTDVNIIPMTYHDFVISTNGGDLTVQTPTGFLQSTN